MTVRLSLLIVFFVLLSACSVEEEVVILEEPMVEEPSRDAASSIDCESGDEDGIGGTGCDPVE